MAQPDASLARSVIAIAVVKHEGKYLIGLRPAGVPLAGYWEFPGGKVQPGETPGEAAARECLEEAGLTVRVVGRYPDVEHDYPHGKLLMHFFACELAASATGPLPDRFRWVRSAELSEYKFPPANARMLTALEADHDPFS